ncbi:MAG: OmpL47-type beta-barrel domain-containing protein, partial [Candidatus Thorarchaeota archaeon]
GFALIDDSVYPPLYGVMYRIDSGPWQYLNLEQIDPWMVGDPWILYPEFNGRVPLVSITAEGVHTVEWYSVDMAGNSETVHEVTFGIDMTAPELSVTVTGTLGDNNWFVSNVGFTVMASDSSAGLIDPMDGFGPEFWFRIDEGSYQYGRLSEFSFLFTSEGYHTFEMWIYDNTGSGHPDFALANEAYNMTRIWIDKTPPTTLLTLELSHWDPDASGFLWTNEPPTLCYDWDASSDTYSGFAIIDDSVYPMLYGVMYSIDGGPWQYLNETQIDPWLVGNPWELYADYSGRVPLESITTEGIHTIQWYSIDKAGNEEALHEVTFGIDLTPPEVTVTISGTLGSDGWYTSNGLLSVTAADTLSGLLDPLDGLGPIFSYRIDSGPIEQFGRLGTWLSIDTEGLHEIEIWVQDYTGNEWYELIPLNIDKTPPEITLTIERPPDLYGWYTSAVSVTINVTDWVSGIESGEFLLIDEAGTWELSDFITTGVLTFETTILIPVDGIIYVTVPSAINQAGNVAESALITLNIDETPPATDISVAGLFEYEDWLFGVATVTLAPTDPLSGVSETFYSLNGEPWTSYTSPFNVYTEGVNTVNYYSVDTVGNVESEKSYTFNLDTTPPVIELDLSGIQGAEGWYLTEVTVTATVTDAMSGILLANFSVVDHQGTLNYYEETAFEENEYVFTFTITVESSDFQIEVVVYDYGGHMDYESRSFGIDTTLPETTLTTERVLEGVNVTLEATDATSGVADILYSIDDMVTWMQYTAEFTLTGEVVDVYYYSVDVAGNSETVKMESVIIEKTTDIIYTGDTSGNYSDSVVFEAILIDSSTQLPLEGKLMVFVIGTQTTSAVTGLDGVAHTEIVLNQAAGVYVLSITVDSDETYLGSSVEIGFVIEKEQATASYTGATVVSSLLETFELRATIFDDDDGNWGDLSGICVTITIYNNEMDIDSPVLVEGPYVVGNTDVEGIGVVIVEISNLPAGTYLIVVSFKAEDNLYYQGPDSDTVTLTIYEPSGDFVTGGGWIWDSDGHRGHFGFVVKYRSDGTLKGCFIYIYKDGDWLVIIKSTELTGLAIVDNHAYFEAKVCIMQFNFRTFECLWSVESHTIKVDAWDNACTGEEDVFQMCVYDENGLLWHEAGFNPYGYLEGGNIRIHTRND